MTGRRRILFVDDDEHLLAGLRRGLRSMRHSWEMAFVRGGVEAFARFRERPFDVVVTDMRMPDLDGVELLRRVRDFRPETVRFALSGTYDQETAVGVAGVVHQFLAKPCDLDRLR